MTIAEQLNDVIDVLSERLGVAADYVYQAMMNQAQLVLIRNIIFLLICISIFAVTGIYMKKTLDYGDDLMTSAHERGDNGFGSTGR